MVSRLSMGIFAYILGALGLLAAVTYGGAVRGRKSAATQPAETSAPASQADEAKAGSSDAPGGPTPATDRAYEGELDPSGRRAQLPKPPQAAEPPQAPELPQLPRVAQKTITDSLYKAVAEGNPYPFKDIADAAQSLDIVTQTYIAAALMAAKPRIEELQRSITDTIATFKEIEKKVAEFNAKLGGIVSGINQVIGSLGAGGQLAAGLGNIGNSAIQLGINEPTTQDYLKSRLADLAWLRDWEGADCHRGLRLQERNQPYSRTSRRIEADPIASTLDEVKKGEQFWFCPSLEQFQEIGIKAGAYSLPRFAKAIGAQVDEVWARPEDDRPVDAYQVQDYTLGYAQGQNGIEQTSEAKFYVIGRADALAGRPSQVLPKLGLWSQSHLGNG